MNPETEARLFTELNRRIRPRYGWRLPTRSEVIGGIGLLVWLFLQIGWGLA